MRTLITALTQWLEADTTLKRIAAETAELGDYARGLQDGVEEAQGVWVSIEAEEDD